MQRKVVHRRNYKMYENQFQFMCALNEVYRLKISGAVIIAVSVDIVLSGINQLYLYE